MSLQRWKPRSRRVSERGYKTGSTTCFASSAAAIQTARPTGEREAGGASASAKDRRVSIVSITEGRALLTKVVTPEAASEREQFDELLAEAGFELVGVTEPGSIIDLVEAQPTPLRGYLLASS
jgi:hypothetical protein